MKSARIAFSIAAAMTASGSALAAGVVDEVAAKEAELVKLRAEVAPLVAPLTVTGADLRVFASLTPLVESVAEINARPPAARLITVRSTGRNGNLWYNGGAWCGSYVKLDESDSLNVKAALSNVAASIRDDGAIALGSRVNIDGHVQVKFQFKGHRIYYPFGSYCPSGGGVGSSIGVDFKKTLDLQLLLAFARSADGRSIDYKASFVSPKEVKVTAEIEIKPITTLGQPMGFDLPQSPIASGSFPLLISKEGKFELPGGGERVYSFVLTPAAFVANKDGITGAWKSTVQFK